ncbi:hypothetical protein GCM10011409_42570 [Lentibacillus populi]|uniref:Uncharacterized protein n=1 Tax=Lentibacillus populi TaxID=1827502 RepID=A0A9W5X7Y8_9BACI|nr:hypothetical protein GCM10011409_42570 [Lentibacillus populi]
MYLLSHGRLLKCQATIGETMKTLKIGVIGGSSITYPNAWFAIHALEEFTAGSFLSQEEKLKDKAHRYN